MTSDIRNGSRSSTPRPVGWREVVNPVLSRRGFLTGGATAPLALRSALAQAGEATQYTFELNLSSDGTILTALQYRQTLSGSGKPKSTPIIAGHWETYAASYGPLAYFDLSVREAEAAARRVVVRRAQFGEVQPVELTFLFTPCASKDCRGATISLTSKLWKRPGKNDWTSATVDFEDFAECKPTAALSAVAEAVHANDQLTEMFEDRIATDESNHYPLKVEFDAHATWRLRRDHSVAAAAFNGRVTCAAFQFGWRQCKDRAPFFYGHAEPADAVRADENFTLGPAGGMRLFRDSRLIEGAALHARFEVRRIETPLFARPKKGPKFQTYTKVSFGPSTLSGADGEEMRLSGLKAAALHLTETRLKSKYGQLRHTLWGDVEDRQAPWPVSTPAGRLVVGAPERPEPEKPAKSDKPSEPP